MSELLIGQDVVHNTRFALPLDAVAQTFSITGIRGAGKSSTAAVMAEAMCAASLPWVALDPVSTWWGLRVNADGSPSDFHVVVLGGPKGDLPIDKDSGRKIAEALIHERVCAVIDLSQESKRTWRRFVTDFSLTLMELNPSEPRHIFFEEAPEWVPQRTKVAVTAECKEAVERLIRLGRNRGYGATLISQRPATVDKDVLSQCENLIVLRTVGPHDRHALKDWLGDRKVDLPAGKGSEESFLSKLEGLANGEGYFWSPAWLRVFQHIKIRPRTTYNPGETRKVGAIAKQITMADVKNFVDRVSKQLSKKVVAVSGRTTIRPVAVKITEETMTSTGADNGVVVQTLSTENQKLQSELDELKKTVERLNRSLREAEQEKNRLLARFQAVTALRKLLAPQYAALQQLFEDAMPEGPENGPADLAVYQPWLSKAGSGTCRKMLEVVLDRKRLTRAQLSTLSGCSIRSSGFKNNLSWLRTNRLVKTEGEIVELMPLS